MNRGGYYALGLTHGFILAVLLLHLAGRLA